jgi:hypothetical protein
MTTHASNRRELVRLWAAAVELGLWLGVDLVILHRQHTPTDAGCGTQLGNPFLCGIHLAKWQASENAPCLRKRRLARMGRRATERATQGGV